MVRNFYKRTKLGHATTQWLDSNLIPMDFNKFEFWNTIKYSYNGIDFIIRLFIKNEPINEKTDSHRHIFEKNRFFDRKIDFSQKFACHVTSCSRF